jgi:magnesium transporter
MNLTKEIVDKLVLMEKRSGMVQDMRDVYLRCDTMMEDLYENINSLLNIYISLSSQKTNEVMRVLTVFSAFFLPLTFLVGVYGMNFDYMPELKMKYGYLGIWAVMILTTLLIYRNFKRNGWI